MGLQGFVWARRVFGPGFSMIVQVSIIGLIVLSRC